VQETIRLGHVPSILELLDERSSDYIAKHLGRLDLPAGVVHLIAQTDGAAAKSTATEIGEVWKSCGLKVEVETGRDDLIEFRKSFHPALEKLGNVLIEDVAVPRSQLGKMFAEIRRIETEFDLEIPTVAHAGDGNLHPNFIYQGSDIPDRIWQAADALFKSAVALGGTLTGEHGVGMLKRRWLKDELGEAQWQLQLKIKQLFDPKGILNPGKVFAVGSNSLDS
jgi:glycolate oxidase